MSGYQALATIVVALVCRVAGTDYEALYRLDVLAQRQATEQENAMLLHCADDDDDGGLEMRQAIASAGGEVPVMLAELPAETRECFPKAEEALQMLSDMYDGKALSSFALTNHDVGFDDVKAATGDSFAHVYGELLPQSVVKMLADVGAKPGWKYYDLGSGTGKTVLLASLLGLDATGVELVDNRFRASCARAERARQFGSSLRGASRARFVQDDFLKQDVSDADLLFAHSTLFNWRTLEGLADRARRMKPGSLVISAQGLPAEELETLRSLSLPATWSKSATFTLQQVKPSSFNAAGAVRGPSMGPSFLQRSVTKNTCSV